jgi:hypothetical protein
VDALLEHLAAVYYVLAGLVSLFPSARARALGAGGVALVGLAAAADAVGAPGTDGGFATINEVIGLSGIAIVIGALESVLRPSVVTDPSTPPDLAPTTPVTRFDPLLLVGLLLIALSPHLILVGLGTALALAAAARAATRAGRPSALLLVLLTTLSLGAGFGLLLTILGPESGRLAAAAEWPTSLAAERLLTLFLSGGALLLGGLPPLHRVPWGRQLAPLSALLLIRLVAPGFPGGLLTWQAPAMLVLAAGTMWSALQGRWAWAATAGGMMALWSGPPGAVAGGVLVAWGWLVELVTARAPRHDLVLAARWRGISALPAAVAALPALTAGLRAQVVVSVATVAVIVAGFVAQWKRGPRRLRAPLY